MKIRRKKSKLFSDILFHSFYFKIYLFSPTTRLFSQNHCIKPFKKFKKGENDFQENIHSWKNKRWLIYFDVPNLIIYLILYTCNPLAVCS